MINFKQYINESNIDIDKIKEECKDINSNIDYSSSDWEKEFINKTNWKNISYNKKLSEEFIEYFKDNVNWGDISWKQDLSESFIEKYKDNVDWHFISLKQDLSELFIEKYKDKINFICLFDNENISNEFILNNIQWFIDKNVFENSWRFDNKEFKDKFYKYKKLFGS